MLLRQKECQHAFSTSAGDVLARSVCTVTIPLTQMHLSAVTLLMLVIVKMVRRVNSGTFDSARTTPIQVIAQEHDVFCHMSMEPASREGKPRFLIRTVRLRRPPM
jgi:hypothetical protein